MKFKILHALLFISFFTSPAARAQSWQWAVRAGGAGNDFANCLDADDAGNSFISGKFFNSISFGTTVLSAPGVWGVYVAKFDNSGNLIWAKVAASDSSLSVNGICVDAAGNISITGQYSDTIVFENGIANLISSGSDDIYVAHFDSSGNFLWTRSAGGSGIDFAGGIDADRSGNIFVTGDFHTTSFPYSGSRVFLLKYDEAGNQSWLTTSITPGTGHFGNSIQVDSAGNSFITGEFFNTLVFDSSIVIDAGNPESNAFIAKFDSSGMIMWGQKAGAPTGYCGSKAIAIDAGGNSYITGFYHGTISLGPYSITGTSGIASDVFIAKCDAAGNFLWVSKSIGAGSSRSITADPAGNTFLCGNFSASVTFGQDALTSTGMNDIFVTAIDSSGNYLWATACGGVQEDFTGGIKSSSSDIFLAGYFSDTIRFNSSVYLADDSSTTSDAFLAKLNLLTGLQEQGNEKNVIRCYPDPAMSEICFDGIPDNGQYTIKDAAGKMLASGVVTQNHCIGVSSMKSGIYFISIQPAELHRPSVQFKWIKN
jgi:hypothetical protein